MIYSVVQEKKALFALANPGCAVKETRLYNYPELVEECQPPATYDYRCALFEYTNSVHCDPYRRTRARVASDTKNAAYMQLLASHF